MALSSTISTSELWAGKSPEPADKDVCPTVQNRYRVRGGEGAIEVPAATYFFTNKAREAV